AHARVRTATARVSDATWIYKKIDSTLRGDPAGELGAVLNTLGETRALVAPAFPAQGRTTRNGHQYVDGVLLEQSAFARVISTSNLVALFGHIAPTTLLTLDVVRAGHATIHARIADARVIITDAETDADLDTIAQAALDARIRVWCGSAGLARAMARQITLTPTAPAPRDVSTRHGITLAVIGSRHPRTREQVEFARAQGVPVIQPDARVFTAESETGIVATRERIAAQTDRAVILTTVGCDDAPLEGRELAARLAQIVVPLIARGNIGKLVLSGGDIAAAVCHALDADALWLRGEIEAGVPWGALLGGTGAGLTVVTKAGGLGLAETVWNAVRV
ncbi:MAG: hypothetical protein N2559_13980, partial [Anaerolineae bacterium]|nr:hypothetical protein [Anaerolineae bacterium]